MIKVRGEGRVFYAAEEAIIALNERSGRLTWVKCKMQMYV
jgi:hypothetical protein